jgi:hypothetical protein
LLLHAKSFLEVNGVVAKIFYKKGDDEAVKRLVDRANGIQRLPLTLVCALIDLRSDASLDITTITDDPYTVAQALLSYFHSL